MVALDECIESQGGLTLSHELKTWTQRRKGGEGLLSWNQRIKLRSFATTTTKIDVSSTYRRRPPPPIVGRRWALLLKIASTAP